jgi:3-phytase
VEESDGSHVVSANLGPDYPLGLLVVHDGDDTPDEGRPSTNFKFVPAHRVIIALDLDI